MVLVRERWGAAARMLRAVLFAVVLAGGVMAVQYRVADHTSLARLHEDLREQRVEAIVYRYEVHNGYYRLDVRWSTGPFSWWQFNEGGGTEVPQMIEDAFPEEYDAPLQGRTFERDLRTAIGDQDIDVRTASKMSIRSSDLPGSWFLRWETPFGWFQALVAVSALAMFGVMLACGGHRYANRWAWTWLFLSSPLGVLAYLYLERRPFPPVLPARAKPPIGGLTGFFLALPAAIAFTFATASLAHLIT